MSSIFRIVEEEKNEGKAKEKIKQLNCKGAEKNYEGIRRRRRKRRMEKIDVSNKVQSRRKRKRHDNKVKKKIKQN